MNRRYLQDGWYAVMCRELIAHVYALVIRIVKERGVTVSKIPSDGFSLAIPTIIISCQCGIVTDASS